MTLRDPHFDATAWDIRGFDLGDDAELLDELERRRAHERLEVDDLLLLGVLRHRAGDEGAAASCFQQAAERGGAAGLAHYMQHHVLLRLGRLPEAARALEQAGSATPEDGLVPVAELCHAYGNLRRAQGDLPGAVARYREGLDADAGSAPRWLQTGTALVRLERFEEADEAFERALGADPECHEAMMELAMLASRNGDAATTASWLQRAAQLEPSHLEHARRDPRLAALRDAEPIAALLRPPPPPDLFWLDALPGWVQELRADPAVATLGIAWLDRKQSQELAADLQAAYENGPTGTMHTEATRQRSQELLESRRAIARGPSSRTRDRVSEDSLLFIDTADPDRLYFAPSASYPPFLWLDAGTSPARLAQVIAEFFPRPALHRLQMPRVSRGFMGYRLRFGVPSQYSGEVEPANAAELDRHFALNPFVEAGLWGSAFDDDPWPDEIPLQPGYMLKMSTRQRRVAEQAPGAVWSVSRRTRHSRSYLTIELHQRDMFVAQVRYRPNRHPEVVEQMNEFFGCDYPTDMPIDAVAALLGFQFDGAADLRTRLDATADPDEIAGLLAVLAALRHSDLGMVRLYRRYMDHPDPVVRTTLCNVFAAYNYESLLEETTVTEPDPEIREQIEALLDEGIGVSEYDPYHDYELEDDEDEIDIDADVEPEPEEPA